MDREPVNGWRTGAVRVCGAVPVQTISLPPPLPDCHCLLVTAVASSQSHLPLSTDELVVSTHSSYFCYGI